LTNQNKPNRCFGIKNEGAICTAIPIERRISTEKARNKAPQQKK
jgi:hypothetical protein